MQVCNSPQRTHIKNNKRSLATSCMHVRLRSETFCFQGRGLEVPCILDSYTTNVVEKRHV